LKATYGAHRLHEGDSPDERVFKAPIRAAAALNAASAAKRKR
jgi:hypothetical protein